MFLSFGLQQVMDSIDGNVKTPEGKYIFVSEKLFYKGTTFDGWMMKM